MLPFEEVVEALGRTGQHDLGLKVVPVDAIVGTVDRSVDFDRGLRRTSARLRSPLERLAAAQRRGEALPPVSLFRSATSTSFATAITAVDRQVARRTDIDAYSSRSRRACPGRTLVSDLPLKDHERLFRERVPLPVEWRRRTSSAIRGTSAC